MVAVLGVSGLYHDAAAALVVDGRIVAAVQEERLSRIKHDASLPWRAMKACLAEGAIAARDLDEVIFYEQPFVKLERILITTLRRFPRSFGGYLQGLKSQLRDKLWVLDRLADGLEISRGRIRSIDHHESHAASAFYASPFRDAAVLTVDGVGEWDTTVLWRGRGETLTRLEGLRFPHSLGLFYAAITAYLGFEVLGGEYKVMGLAAYGRANRVDALSQALRLNRDGTFELAPHFFDASGTSELGFTPALEGLLGPRRPPGRPWDLTDETDLAYADVAASAQQLLEEAMGAAARWALERAECDHLCLAGGVALNAVANARIAREVGADRVFVQPAAGDAGGALGAAIVGALQRGAARPPPMTTAALGPHVDSTGLAALADALGLSVGPCPDDATLAVQLLEGRVFGWMKGRMEFGPRALGHRSLLASPFDRGLREKVNRLVKKREPFRPLAPSVLRDATAPWFEEAPPFLTPFMTTVVPATAAARQALPAVVHHDGTARLQTVSDGPFAGLLEAVGHIGPAPVLLNTSLNGAGEPIVATATDAAAFVLAHPVDGVIVGDLLLSRRRVRRGCT